MAHSRLKAPPARARQFMPATHSLATGLLLAAVDDCLMLLSRCRQLMLDIWVELEYSTAELLQRAR